MIENNHKLSLKKGCPPSMFVRKVSTGPEGGMFCKVSMRTLVMNVDRSKNVKAKNKMTKDSKYKVR
jgi:hypothetical protein